MTTAAPTPNGPIHQNVVPSEVGWQFVPQYYTFVNKEPHRLHCFYNKNSTFIHGTEGEEGKPCFGQQDRHVVQQAASDLDGTPTLRPYLLEAHWEICDFSSIRDTAFTATGFRRSS
ncbi:hypothetical protein DFP72DRAFT_65617 [Ephemerocybe angulata]|uniref:NTF2 domain-containing protein n=1 Tax=Ephemerocybe angulata TaxID=980116 RepID=A0A8H6HEE3_9AGAR|nr:hypothetical protein DFP72DRAFT_65617 [Tulosesus angulatus]